MNISYYTKKRITDLVINIIMLAFLALTLLPIGWMVYSSLKDSTDIAIGKVGLRRAGRDVLMIVPERENLLIFTADGGLNRYHAQDLSKLKHHSLKTQATSYLLEDEYVWVASANRGLVRASRAKLALVDEFKFPLWGIDMNKVSTSYIKKQGYDIFVSLEYKDFDDVLRFDVRQLKFMKLIKGAKSQYFPEAAKAVIKEFPDVEGEIFSEARDGDVLYMGTGGGRLYKYDLNSKQIVAQALLPQGHLLVRWHNYIDMWRNVNFGLYLKNSLIICGFTMVFAMIFATFAAYALSRFRFPGADIFSNAILATQMVPMIMYLIPLYIMFVRFTIMTGIPVKGTYPGMILIYSAWFLPFSIWILRGFFAAIPKELEEAALIDGCSRLRVFWHIALPLAIPGIIATGIYVFLTAWDELMFAWVLTDADTMTIPVGIRLFVGNYQNRFDLMMAAAVVATLPVVVLFFMLQRHIVRGLTAGAVKG